ncbi:MAG: lamin tail domain-containing protein [Caldilineaceae bacterium]
MTRSQLLFVILLNAIISFAIALAVAWIVDARRPDPERLAASFTPTPSLAVLVETLPATPDTNASGTATQSQSQPAATDTPAPSGQTIDYVVQSGDTLAVIAAKHGSTQDAIIKANNISDPNLLFVGAHLTIPVGNSSSSPAVPTTPAPPTGAGLHISQVIAAGDLANEAVEIVNDGDQAYSLQGWKLQKEGGPEYTFADVQLFQGAGLKVFSGGGTDNSINRYWNQPAALWQSGAVIKLINSQGNVATTFTVP